MLKVLLIIPAYNEAKNLYSLVESIRQVDAIQLDFIIINDCSTDNTIKICDKYNFPTIHLPCNLGIGGAVQTGYKYAHEHAYDIAVQIDGDGQHRPEYVAELIKPIIENKADMSIGSRYLTKQGFQSSFMRRIGINYFSHLLFYVTKQRITDPTSGFRACNAEVIELFAKRYPVDYPEPEAIMYLKRHNYRITEVSVEMQARLEGQSSINALKSIYYMAKVSLAILIDKFRKQIV